MSTRKHLRAIVLLPVMVTVVVPGALVVLTGGVNIGWSLSPPLHLVPTLFGLLLIGTGLLAVVHTIGLFAARGEGTLAPWDPTRKLVQQSLYRHMRNPMISGVLLVLLGEVAVAGSIALLGWTALFLMANLIYIPLVEERSLEGRFGQEYARYRQNVPAWIPRLRPWDPDMPQRDRVSPSRSDSNA
jgi:protein-S-isoprenylcysteine O-methyltransferase Ste14